jgi:hypothetical protein
MAPSSQCRAGTQDRWQMAGASVVAGGPSCPWPPRLARDGFGARPTKRRQPTVATSFATVSSNALRSVTF